MRSFDFEEYTDYLVDDSGVHRVKKVRNNPPHAPWYRNFLLKSRGPSRSVIVVVFVVVVCGTHL